jgi:adenosine deaminase
VIDLSIPLVELHRHLDGNVRLQTILDLGRKHNLPLPAWNIDALRPYVQVVDPQPGVMAFISKFHWPMAVLLDEDACRRVAYENVEDAKHDGLDYIELRFSPWFMADTNELDSHLVVEGIVNGIKDGERDFGVKVGLIGILSRTYGTDTAWKELEALLNHREKIIALDLAGDEAHFPAEWFRDHFRHARDAGWHVTTHAGESAGPESIWKSIQELGAERIGHAISASEDPALMDYLAQQRIGVESCLTSNIQTSCVPDYPSHPLKIFLTKGILATINTDDPGISGIDLSYEYNVAAPLSGLTRDQIHQAQANALDVAFLTKEEKQLLLSNRSRSKTDYSNHSAAN